MFQEISNLIADPINGPYEGEDFIFDTESNTIHVTNANHLLAAKILREANFTLKFETKLVKYGVKGDTIILGLDNLQDSPAKYKLQIEDMLYEVKETEEHKFCIYVNKVRKPFQFKRLASAKRQIKVLSQAI
jgi:hypothetical protein